MAEPLHAAAIPATEEKPSGQPLLRSLLQTLMAAGRFATFLQGIDKAGLTSVLAEQGPFTVFAPTDEVFSRLPEDYVESLLHDRRIATEVFEYHIVSGLLTTSDVQRYGSVRTLQGTDLPFYGVKGELTVAGTRMVAGETSCANGIIYALDGLLIP